MTETDVIEARRLRNAARTVFDTQREMVRADLDAAGVGKRIATRLVDDGKVIAEEAADAANTHRTVVTLGALGLTGWFLRGPILAFVDHIVGRDDTGEDDDYDYEPADYEPADYYVERRYPVG
ncbi:hypothetical protein [Croceicoccus marinus]|jgi:hypothetical protein|uniref:Uncharacterized protein n=1 Tax=Croceicoccus marinus TaxID=450378 RepID=A0A7G6VR74_9SPHN|nr:hypothetical protein [Croceicoccus marinus]QNE04239.1 hypothetical protein H4O24_09550 [Croceicoccus marinus]